MLGVRGAGLETRAAKLSGPELITLCQDLARPGRTGYTSGCDAASERAIPCRERAVNWQAAGTRRRPSVGGPVRAALTDRSRDGRDTRPAVQC
jgi:hypothetical protein